MNNLANISSRKTVRIEKKIISVNKVENRGVFGQYIPQQYGTISNYFHFDMTCTYGDQKMSSEKDSMPSYWTGGFFP